MGKTKERARRRSDEPCNKLKYADRPNKKLKQAKKLPVDDDNDGGLELFDPKDDQCELAEHMSDSSLDTDDDDYYDDDDDYSDDDDDAADDHDNDDENGDDDSGGGGDMEFATTTTPRDLCYVLQGLTDAQKSDIRDMGFQSILSFNIDDIPVGLGRWLLDSYDHQRNELNVGTHVIKITPSKVHDVLGVPMGEIPVSEKKKVSSGDDIRNIWRKQPFIRPVIFVKHVIEKLKSCTEGGTLFKLNFLVVFNTIMGETTKSATVNQKFLTPIINEDNIRNMDWCSYIITCLKRTKEMWNGIKPYNGPLTILAVLYAHELQLKHSPENAIAPAIRYVTTAFLANIKGSMYDKVQEDNQLNAYVEDQAMLENHMEYAEGQPQTDEGQTSVDQNVNVLLEYEVQPQTDDGQTAIGQNVNLLQVEEEAQVQSTNHNGQTAIDQSAEVQVQETNPNSALNLKLPTGPPNAVSLSGLSANLVHCNRLEPPRDKKAHVIVIDDDDDVVILEPKHEHFVEKFSSGESGMVSVQGYTVKQSSATILEVILKKHGDIAADCVLKTDSIISSMVETVCEAVKQIQATDVFEKLGEIEKQVSDAKAINIDVSWIEAHLETVHKRREDTERYSLLMKKKADHLLDKNVAQIKLRKRRAELAAAEERSKEARRRVEALQLVAKNMTDNLFESKAQIDSWVNDPVI